MYCFMAKLLYEKAIRNYHCVLNPVIAFFIKVYACTLTIWFISRPVIFRYDDAS